jgi:hypothetical protein
MALLGLAERLQQTRRMKTKWEKKQKRLLDSLDGLT